MVKKTSNAGLKSDSYYEEQSRIAIEAAVDGAEGKPLDEVRFWLRRSYPFELPRKGRPYKIWNRLVQEKEVELGLELRKHKKSETRVAKEKPLKKRKSTHQACIGDQSAVSEQLREGEQPRVREQPISSIMWLGSEGAPKELEKLRKGQNENHHKKTGKAKSTNG